MDEYRHMKPSDLDLEQVNKDLAEVFNKHNLEAYYGGVPDYILAHHTLGALENFRQCHYAMQQHYIREMTKSLEGDDDNAG